LLGEHRQAIARCEEALAVHQEVGDTADAGFTWDTLGYSHHQLGDLPRAIDCYQSALALFERYEHRRGRGTVLHHLGDAHFAAGRSESAQITWRAALELLEDLGHPAADEVRAKLDRLDGKH
jgi:tetratricopeptide (TPR) repeat protein